jgi:hypothetical protein
MIISLFIDLENNTIAFERRSHHAGNDEFGGDLRFGGRRKRRLIQTRGGSSTAFKYKQERKLVFQVRKTPGRWHVVPQIPSWPFLRAAYT